MWLPILSFQTITVGTPYPVWNREHWISIYAQLKISTLKSLDPSLVDASTHTEGWVLLLLLKYLNQDKAPQSFARAK